MTWLLVPLLMAQPRLDYKKELEDRALKEILTLMQAGEESKAERYLSRFEEDLFQSAHLHYELALFYNRQGQLDEAMEEYNRSLAVDPHLYSALYDRAEIFLLEGDLEGAQRDLGQLVMDGVEHWVVYFRLAETYALQKEGILFERNLMLAIRYGFSLPMLLESGKQWKDYAKDPVVGEHLRRVIQLYGDEDLWELLLE